MYGQPPGQPPGFNPPPYGYGPPQGPPPPMMPGGMPPMDPMGYGQPPKTHGLAIASMICGILAIVPGCCCGLFGMPLSIAALVMGLIAMNQITASAGQLGGKGMALAGTICGGVAIALDVAALFLNVGTQIMEKAGHV